jgi:predicted amidohydrolase YtcJ
MILLYNGRIHTLNPSQPLVSAIVIQNDHIIFSGSDHAALHEFPEINTKLDLNGKTILPGLCDSHMHLEYYALNLQRVNAETATLQECLQHVAERAHQQTSSPWILGHGWNHNLWDGQYGTAIQLDAVSQSRPVYLTAKSYHAAWVNTTVLQMAGITSRTPDPEGGRLSRDADGNPTGILFEAAMELVKAVLPRPDVNVSKQAIQAAQSTLWKMGITAVHDFDGATSFAALQELDNHDQLRLRVTKSIPLENLDHAFQVGLRSGFGSAYLKVGSIKLFSDGALGPQTAAMLEPYEHADKSKTGMLMLDAEQIFEYGQKAADAGLSLAIHAIGDRANHEVINGFARLRQYEKDRGLPSLRHRIEHVQLLHPDDISRLAKLDLIASVQPIHAPSDMIMADYYWGQRCQYAYAYQSLLSAGTSVAFGSDAPVESPNPFYGLHAAVTRRRQDGSPGETGWHADQRFTLQQALQAYTTGAAFASGQDSHLGQLTAGHFADLIVMDIDPFSIQPQDLWQLKPAAVMVAGNWVWNESV